MRTEGNSFQAHQPFSVKIRFEGSGNAKLIDMPTIAWPEGLEVYDTKSESKFFKNAQSYKEFEVLLIPRKSGEVVIPAFEFSHFNPELKKYITTVTEPLLLTITPGQPGAINSANAPSVGAVAEDGQTTHLNIQPIVEMPEAQLITKKMRWSFYTTVFILTVLAMGTSFFKKFKNLLNEPSLELIITKKLKQLDQFITNKDFRHVGTEGVNLTYALAAYLSGQKAANLEWSKLIEIMPINLKERFIAPLSSSFEYFQLLGFSPEAVHKSIVSANQTETEIKKLKKTADEISKELRKNESE